jgi:hypothetical protein
VPGSQGILGAEVYPRMFDGTYWQRVRGSIANGLQVQDATAQTYHVTIQTELLTAILTELRVQTFLLKEGLNVLDDAATLRQDAAEELNLVAQLQ